MAEKEAKFRFVQYQILESELRFDPQIKTNKKLNVTFNQVVGVNDSDGKMRLELETTVEDECKALFLHVKTYGYFEFDSQISDETKDVFFKVNAPAILFPYVRAYIGTLTALSGIEPVILPTLNLTHRDAE